MRWQIHLSYLGTNYCGWQKQPSSPSVQQTIEEAFTLILKQPIAIVGCGRTDTGVHARAYVAHAEVIDVQLTDKVVYQINAVLPLDISINEISEVHENFHARFDAVERHYKYYLHFNKNPFLNGTSYYFHQQTALDPSRLHAAAALLMEYDEFLPFCKTGSDADHFRCELTESKWVINEERATYSIKANRFLRGMVRLTVGACINVAMGKPTLNDLRECLERQTTLNHAWSVPAEGLFLEKIIYP